MLRRWFFSFTVLLALQTLSAGLLAAQNLALADRGPRFLWAPVAGSAPKDATNAELLHRRVSITVFSGTLDDALKEIARQANLDLIYSKALVPAERRVTLQAQDITVAAALTELLLGARVDVVLLPTGQVGLVRKLVEEKQEPGTIVGRVTDASTEGPIVSAQVWVEGGQGSALTDADGRYRLAGVAAGLRKVTVSIIGYKRETQEIEVPSGGTATLDFALAVSPTTLTELVVTATGVQRRLELGHTVGRINADSVVKEAPISTVTELLTGRVSGVQVFQRTGAVGGEVKIQIRGPNSISLSNEPIVVVDGVRYTSSAAERAIVPSRIKGENTSPLNDLNPNDIESIEVVKGPSAATLYGTDAANGVLVITTKRGRAGPARWNFHAIGSRTEVAKDRFPDLYWGYGRRVSNNQPYPANCSLQDVAFNFCVQDSVAVFTNPLKDAATTMFTGEPRWETGASVAGGLADFRYFFSANYEDVTGPVRMPKAVVEELTEVRGELPEEILRPNAMNKLNLRANMAAVLGGTIDLRVNTGYTRNTTRAMDPGITAYNDGLNAFTPETPYGTGQAAPGASFSRVSTEFTDRFVGTASAQWRALPWLIARAQMGLDLSQRNHYALARRGEVPGNFSAVSTCRSGRHTQHPLGVQANSGGGNARRREANSRRLGANTGHGSLVPFRRKQE